MARKTKPRDSDYALQSGKAKRIAAPKLDYRPPRPRKYRPRIALIGCGGITLFHLAAYRRAKWNIVALCDVSEAAAAKRRDEFYPKATVCTDYRRLLERGDIDVVDIATHPGPRVAIVTDAIAAGKHVLSQKPFVTDLAVGRRLVAAGDRAGVKLAVNQNGRWAPHMSYMRQAIAAGLIGEVVSIDIAIHWDHNWVAGTPFDRIAHLLLYDFAIHWFDALHCFVPRQRADQVSATLMRSEHQAARPPLIGHVRVAFPSLIASMHFVGATRFGAQDRTVIVGSAGTLTSEGADLNHQTVMLHTERGVARPRLAGSWFTSGFEGTMGELLRAIEEDREPLNSARDNLASLEMAFAAIASAERGRPVSPGSLSKLDPRWIQAS